MKPFYCCFGWTEGTIWSCQNFISEVTNYKARWEALKTFVHLSTENITDWKINSWDLRMILILQNENWLKLRNRYFHPVNSANWSNFKFEQWSLTVIPTHVCRYGSSPFFKVSLYSFHTNRKSLQHLAKYAPVTNNVI